MQARGQVGAGAEVGVGALVEGLVEGWAEVQG